MASNATSKPKTTAITKASSDDGSLTTSGAISTPTANPTAATHSQHSFRPKNRIAMPMSTPTMVAAECMGKENFDNYNVEAFVPDAFLFGISVPDTRAATPRFQSSEIRNSNLKTNPNIEKSNEIISADS